MKIAMIGQKGVPATFGGVERHVEELGARLAAKGHQVTAFCRPYYTKERGPYRGIDLKLVNSVNSKHLDAISHTFLSTLSGLSGDFDIFHYHAIGPSTMAFMPKLIGKKVFATVHGLDWQRDKWGRMAKAYLKLGEWSSARFADRTIVVSKTLKKYYDAKYNMNSLYIPNGIQAPNLRPARIIKEKHGLEPGSYALFVGRLVPEKGCHFLIEAFKGIETDCKLVIAGGSSHSGGYEESLKKAAASDPRIIFTGYIYGEELEEVYSNCRLYVQPSLIEGLPIALLEALSYGKAALISDIPENCEVLEGIAGLEPARFMFRSGDAASLRARLATLLADDTLDEAGAAVKGHVFANYNWDLIADMTEKAYMEALSA